MKYHITLFLFALITCTSVYAQSESSDVVEEFDDYSDDTYPVNPADLSTTRDYTKQNMRVRKFDDEKWKEVVGSTNYSENEVKKPKVDSGSDSTKATPKDGSKRRMKKSEDNSSEVDSSADSSEPWASPVLTYVFYGAVILLIAMILFYVLKNVSLKPKSLPLNIDSAEPGPVEDIRDLDTETLLQKAQAARNYRLAIRIYFLELLKKLDEGGFIVWKKDKTNRDYLTELYAKQRYFEEVRSLTLSYEQVWYGEHAVPDELYQRLSSEFNAIGQQLNVSDSQ